MSLAAFAGGQRWGNPWRDMPSPHADTHDTDPGHRRLGNVRHGWLGPGPPVRATRAWSGDARPRLRCVGPRRNLVCRTHLGLARTQ